MTDISAEYLTLFNAITDAVEQLESLRLRLILTQQRAEDLYLAHGEEQVSP